MRPRDDSPCRPTQRHAAVAVFVVLVSLLLLSMAGQMSAAQSGISECIACHTDATKLKALTPPDPPPSEEGEG